MRAGSGRFIVFRSNFEVLIFVEGEEPSHEKPSEQGREPTSRRDLGGDASHFTEKLILSRMYTVLF